MIRELEPLDHGYVRGRKVYSVLCPVECERSLESFREKFGGEVIINGYKWRIIGLETSAVNAPLRVDECIRLMVDSEEFYRPEGEQ